MAKMSIEAEHLARIEGHGDIRLVMDGDKVATCEFRVTEAARLFESMVRGRIFSEVPYVSSRICGICSASHTVTDILAIERIFGIEVTDRTRALRELLIYGSYLQNHATHLFVFAAPDFLGHKSVFPLSDADPMLFDHALGLKQLGNDLCRKVGGRPIHPITAVVGGFTSEISPSEYLELAERMDAALEFAVDTVDIFSNFGMTALETKGDFMAMVEDGAYPVIGSDEVEFVREGKRFSAQDILDEIREVPVDSAAAFLAEKASDGSHYMTGALARINASWENLTEEARFAAAKSHLRPLVLNPYSNNVAQAVEIVDALTRCSAICRSLSIDAFEGDSKPVDFEVRGGFGVGFTEAPRGTLFHILDLDDEGRVKEAQIITPTSENIANIEDDMRILATRLASEGAEQAKIQLEIEKLVRAYDPCLSCSVH